MFSISRCGYGIKKRPCKQITRNNAWYVYNLCREIETKTIKKTQSHLWMYFLGSLNIRLTSFRLGELRHAENALNEELETEIYRWALETVGVMMFGLRLGCLDGAVHIPNEENRYFKNLVRAFSVVYIYMFLLH